MREKKTKMLRKFRYFCLKKIKAKLDFKQKKHEKLRQMKAKNIKQATSVLKKKCLLSNKEKKKLL